MIPACTARPGSRATSPPLGSTGRDTDRSALGHHTARITSKQRRRIVAHRMVYLTTLAALLAVAPTASAVPQQCWQTCQQGYSPCDEPCWHGWDETTCGAEGLCEDISVCKT